MVQNWRFLFIAILLMQACSGSKYRKSDCFDCTTEKQSWNKFSWNLMEGHWRGNLETVINEVSAKEKVKKEEAVDVSFVTGVNFFQSYKIESCGDFPKNSFVMLGQSWQAGEKEKVFEVFAEGAEDTVVYGRSYITKMNGQNVCQFKSYGGSVGMNRLALPAVRFTQRMTSNGRALASGSTPEMEVNFEFLNFEPKWMDKKPITAGGRKPASVNDQERPPLFFRVFQITRKVNGPYSTGEWTSTKEYLYRLWKVE